MRIAFIGAVEGSLRALQTICEAGYRPDLVVTLGPERAADHSDYADLAPICAGFGLPILTIRPGIEKGDLLAALRAVQPDLILVIGWSRILDADIREVPRVGCLGFHPSALPRMRGRGVVPWQILSGATEGGATLFWLDEGTDTGDIAAQRLFSIDPIHETARSLYDRAVNEMTTMLAPLLDRIAKGERPAVPQDDKRATLCARREPKDGMIDWTAGAAEIDRLIRAVGPPYPCAFTHDASGAVMTLREARLNGKKGYYLGVPGQVQAVDAGTVTVMCGDGECIDLIDFQGRMPRLHDRFMRGPTCS